MKSLTPRDIAVSRVKLLMLWLVPAGLMGIAFLYFYLVQTDRITIGSTNHGVLLDPPIKLLDLIDVDMQSSEQSFATNEKWTMLILGDQQCSDSCREVLYLTRQIHIRLDKSANRVQRVLLVDTLPLAEKASDFIEQEHRFLKLAVVSGSTMEQVDKAVLSPSGEKPIFMLVDQRGWLMMAYYQQHQGNGILKDIKHLLKISR